MHDIKQILAIAVREARTNSDFHKKSWLKLLIWIPAPY